MNTNTIERADEVVGPAATGTAVSVLEPLKKIEAGLATLKTEAAALANVEPAGLDKAQRAFRLRCVKVRTDLDGAYESVNRPMLETQRLARKLVAEIKAAVEALEGPVDAAILERERVKEAERQAKIEAECRRVAALRERIDGIAGVARRATGKPAAEIESKIKLLVAVTVGDDFGDFKAEAARVHAETLEQLREMLAAAQAQEAEAARVAEERAEIERERDLQDRVTAIRNVPLTVRPGASAEAIHTALSELRAARPAGTDWHNALERAQQAHTAAVADLEALHATAVERDRVAAEQAAEAQRLAAERAEQARQDAAAKAARERADREAAEARAAADRQAQEARDAEARKLAEQRAQLQAQQERMARERDEHLQMLMSELQGMQQQVIIAQIGRAGVRKGGTIECIRETLAETEAWRIDAAYWGEHAERAQAVKQSAVESIRNLLAAAEQAAAEEASRKAADEAAATEAAARAEKAQEEAASPAAAASQSQTELDACRSALEDACNWLEGWLKSSRLPAKVKADQFAALARLRQRGGIAA